MRTGEGKTLVATLPAYLNALSDKGVHVVTVNEYLAKRDSEWMSPIYEFLELTVGVTSSNQSHEEKKLAYEADITYTTNNELGFDYLRDNLAFSSKDKVQRELNFAFPEPHGQGSFLPIFLSFLTNVEADILLSLSSFSVK